MKKLLFILFTTGIINSASAQKAFVLEGPSGTRLYYNFDSAKTKLSTGDTFYIPGGMYNLNNTWDIGVSDVSIIGAGHDPDSSNITKSTVLSGSIKIINSADDIILEGFYLTGSVNVYFSQSSTFDFSANCKLKRIVVGNDIDLGSSGVNPLTHNYSFEEVVIKDDLNGGNTTKAMFKYSFIGDRVSGFGSGNVIFQNNQFFGVSRKISNVPHYVINNVSGAQFIDNVFHTASFGGYNLFFLNNDCSNNYGSGNSINSTHSGQYVFFDNLGNIFYSTYPKVIFSGTTQYSNIDINSLNFKEENHKLASGQPYIGPFAGGYKNGGVPSNPHYQSASISDTTTNSGQLNVNIKVVAQGR